MVVEPPVCVKVPVVLFIPTSARLPPETLTLPFHTSSLFRVTLPPLTFSVAFSLILTVASAVIVP